MGCEFARSIRQKSYVLMILCCVVMPAYAQDETEIEPEPQFAYGIESDLSSRYMWRGLACSQDAVSQNSLWLGSHGVTASLWSNYDFNAADGSPSLNELDFGVAYELPVGSFYFEPALQAYYYPDQSELPWTSEVSVTMSTSISSFQPFMTHSLDVKEYSGAYFGELGIEYGQSLWANGEFHALAEVGYGSSKFNEAYLGLAESALQLYHVEADLTVNLTETWYMRPHVSYSWIASDKFSEYVEDGSHFQFGIAFGGDFAWGD